jgi:D-alanine-D-alanine ligase-like ATP-grasp enzyme
MLAMDKWASKAVFRQSGIPVPDGICAPSAPGGEGLARSREFLSRAEKIVVKPRSCGSTVGFPS